MECLGVLQYCFEAATSDSTTLAQSEKSHNADKPSLMLMWAQRLYSVIISFFFFSFFKPKKQTLYDSNRIQNVKQKKQNK